MAMDFRDPDTQLGIMRGLAGSTFVYYSLMSFLLTAIYISQLASNRDNQ